jgi:hypothetical protein
MYNISELYYEGIGVDKNSIIFAYETTRRA